VWNPIYDYIIKNYDNGNESEKKRTENIILINRLTSLFWDRALAVYQVFLWVWITEKVILSKEEITIIHDIDEVTWINLPFVHIAMQDW